MKSFLKKLSLVMMITVMAVAGLFVTGDDEASAASTKREITLNSNFLYYGNGFEAYIHTAETSSNVNATFEHGLYSQSYVKFTLQRHVNGAWSNVATRNGGLAYNDWDGKRNANVTFTNISTSYKASTRVRVQLYSNSNYTGLVQTAYSYSWNR